MRSPRTAHAIMTLLVPGAQFTHRSALAVTAPVDERTIAAVADRAAALKPAILGVNAYGVTVGAVGGDGCDSQGQALDLPGLVPLEGGGEHASIADFLAHQQRSAQ